MRLLKNKVLKLISGFFLAGMFLFIKTIYAENLSITNEEIKITLDTIWVIFAGVLVFFMNTGFAMVESGLNRAKNAVNILAKNFIVFAIASIGYWILGFGLMFGDGNGFIGLKGLFILSGLDNSPSTGTSYIGVYNSLNWVGIPFFAKFFFELVFAGTAATIVSGAVAERIKFHAFIIFSFFLVTIVYPVIGHWIWGGGWLQNLGMLDFAGSTVVHSVGGWAALAGCLILGPRIGKYRKDGSINPVLGHNISLATLGTFILWLGWFGFNAGSTLSSNFTDISRIALITNNGAVAGIFGSTIFSWLFLKKPDLSMILNGCLAGLVAITAPCAYVSILSSFIIGFIAGFLVVVAIVIFDRLKIDDPVGALSVHLVNGIFGTLAVGLFADKKIMPGIIDNGLFTGGGMALFNKQLIGVLTVGCFTFTISLVIWAILKALIGIRVSREEEIRGLDISEHGNEAYPDFQIFLTK